MAHIRRMPYACARCGVVAHDSKGIPVLTIQGLVDSYEVPFNWGYIGQDLGCAECLVKFADELESRDVDCISDNLISVLTHNWGESDDKVIARAAEKVAEYYKKRVSDGH